MSHIFYIKEYGMPQDAHCYEYVASVDSEELEDIFRCMNHVDGSECEDLLRALNVRSMSVGDIVITTTGWGGYICKPCGWEEIERALEVQLLCKVPEDVA